MSIQIDPEAFSLLEKINRFFDERQIAAYLVGGMVRDTLLGRSTADIDIAVSGDALQVASALAEALEGRYVLLDEANRIARIVLARPAVSGTHNQWYVDISALAGDIYQDLSRRDFTINALAVELKSWLADSERFEVIDPFRGQEDIQKSIIRAVNSTVFSADPARLLRAERLSAELRFHIDPDTESLIRRDSRLLSGVAGERVREELLRILNVPGAGNLLISLDNLGILTIIFPELELTRGVEQPKEHHWDVFNHSLQTVRATEYLLRQADWEYTPETVREDIPWSEKLKEHFASAVSSGSTHASLLKLAALLHDISKPETKIISNSRVRFFGHTEQGAEVSSGILERLRFSKKEIKMVETMVRYHLRPTQMSHEGLPTRRAIYRYLRDTGTVAIDILFLSLADHLAARGPDLEMEQWQWHIEQSRCILTDCYQKEKIIAPPKLIDGYDLINKFGLKPGPEIRGILEAIREAQASGELSTREEALYYVKNRLLYRKQNSS